MPLSLPSRPINPELRHLLLVGQMDPGRGLSLAREAWNQTQDQPEAIACLEAGLALGLALNRAERPAEALARLREIEPRLGRMGLAAEQAICLWQMAVARRILHTEPGLLDAVTAAQAALTENGLLLEAALCQRDVAIAHLGVGNWQQAAGCIAEARAWLEARGLTPDAETFAVTQCAHLRRRGDFDAALAILQKAETVFANENLPAELAAVRLYQASIYTVRFETDRAIGQLKSVRETFERLDLPLRQAMTWNDLGVNALNRADLAAAEAAFAASVHLHSQIHTRADLAITLYNLAVVRHDQGDPLAARQQFAKAQAVFKELGDRPNAAMCGLNIGVSETSMGRYGSALRSLEAARNEMEAVGVKEHIPTIEHNVGKTWLALGDVGLAGEHFQKAVAGYQVLGAGFGAARSLVHLGLIEAEAGRYAAALQLVDQARDTAVATRAADYVAVCDQMRGEIRIRANEVAAGLADLKEAEAAFTRLGMPINALGAGIAQADAMVLLNQNDEAEKRYAAALAETAAGLPDLAWRCTSGLAQLAQARGEPGEALAWHQQTISALRSVRGGLQHELLVDAFLNRRMAAIETAIGCAADAGEPEVALRFVEESRAQRLAGRPDWNARQAEDGLGEGLRREMAEIRHKLSGSLEAASSWSILRPASAEQAELMRQLDEKARAYQAHTALASIKDGQPRTGHDFELARMRATLKGSQPQGWTCLAYYWLKDQLLTFAIDEQHVSLTRTRLNPLERLALDLCTAAEPDRRRAMYGGGPGSDDGRRGQANRRYRELLYELLIPRMIRPKLAPDRLLLVVPAGQLHALPFQALIQGDQYLCQQAVLAVVPSLTEVRTSDRDGHVVTPALVVAIDDYGSEQVPLPFAQREARVVAEHLPDATVVTNEQATPSGLRATLAAHDQDPFAVMHFATHAVFEANYGRLSRLVLSGGELLADEIEALNIPAQLVVLAACQSALGQLHAGEDVIGLSQAFLGAGARSILSAQWAVADEDSPKFMDDFYAAYAGRNMTPPAALADTQRRWIEAGRPASTWAAYHLFGAV